MQRTAPAWATILVLSLCGMVSALQFTLVIPLLPEFPELLDISASDSSWLVTATLLTAAVGTPIIARMADMYGKRRMLLVSLGAMILGSVICALEVSFLTMIVGRALQGFGAALIAVGISILRDKLPPERIGTAVALMSATMGIGSALGLPLAGVLSDWLGWHSIFWFGAVTGVVLVVALLVVVEESPVRTPGRFDVVGALVLSAALVCLLLPISKGSAWGWGEPLVVGLLVSSLLLLVALGAAGAARQPTDGRSPHQRPAAGADDQSRLDLRRHGDVREHAGHRAGASTAHRHWRRIRSRRDGRWAGDGAVRARDGGDVTHLRVVADPLGRSRGAARRCCADGPHLRRPRLLRRLGGRDRGWLDAGRDRHGPGLRCDADAHHVLGPDHRDSLGQRSQLPGPIDRHVACEHPGRRDHGRLHDRGRRRVLRLRTGLPDRAGARRGGGRDLCCAGRPDPEGSSYPPRAGARPSPGRGEAGGRGLWAGPSGPPRRQRPRTDPGVRARRARRTAGLEPGRQQRVGTRWCCPARAPTW